MSELPDGVPPAREPEPRPSAAAVVLRRGERDWRVLMGRRSRRSRFMPGHLAFPGGGLDPADRPGEPGADARCVAREVREETGLALDPDRYVPAGERVTPPMFPVRFRTSFFVAEAVGWTAPPQPPSPEELEHLEFVAPARILDAWEQGGTPVPPPVLPILRELAGSGAEDAPAVAARIARVNADEQRVPRIEFVPGVWALPVRTATLPPATHTNVWMPGGGEFVVVDPGCDEPQELERLREGIERRTAAGSRLHAVVLTHHHRDHVRGAATIARALAVPVVAHRATLDRLALPADVHSSAIADGDTIDLDGMALRAMHTPGHAPGHVAFVVEGRDVLIAGDLASGLSTILIDPDEGDMGAYLASLERVRAGGFRLLLPGHGPPLPPAAVVRLIEHRRERERSIEAALDDAGVELATIAERAYRDVPEMPVALTSRQTLAHLVDLERRGRARRVGGPGRWGRVESTRELLERRLREALGAAHVEVEDESARHAGHPGAAGGGGHYRVTVVAEAFGGRSRLERHRTVHAAVADLLGGRIHALSIRPLTPEEWRGSS